MPSWFKKPFGRKEEKNPTPVPIQSTGSSSRRNGSTPTSTSTRQRVSSHDLTMAATTLGSAISPPSRPSNRPNGGNLSSSSSQQRLQEQQDADLALAYSLAQQNNPQFSSMQRTNTTPNYTSTLTSSTSLSPTTTAFPSSQPSLPSPTTSQPPPPPQLRPFSSLPVPPQYQRNPQQQSQLNGTISFSRPPPPSFKTADLAMAAALADSEFAARQADELARASEAVYQAAVNQAMEASLQTANYDTILRELKLWAIDLAAAIDDVHVALDSIIKKQKESSVKLEKALEQGDERRIAKYSWSIEQLPLAEAKLRSLADRLTPVGLAVTELQDLREDVVATSPPVQEAERRRDDIIARLFKNMEDVGLHSSIGGVSSSSSSSSHGGAGPSHPSRNNTNTTNTTMQGPSDIRDLIAMLIEDAQKVPKMPRRRSSTSVGTESSSIITSNGDDHTLSSTRVNTNDNDNDSEVSSSIAGLSTSTVVTNPSAPPPQLLDTAGVTNDTSNTITITDDDNNNNTTVDSSSSSSGVLGIDEKLKSFSLQDTIDDDHHHHDITTSIVNSSARVNDNSAVVSLPTTPSPTTTTTALSPTVQQQQQQQQRGSMFTTPEPFQLSTSKPRTKSSGTSPIPIDAIRRVPAIVSLHYELEKDNGIVSQTVAWMKHNDTITTTTTTMTNNTNTNTNALLRKKNSTSSATTTTTTSLLPRHITIHDVPSLPHSTTVDNSTIDYIKTHHPDLLSTTILSHPLVTIQGTSIASLDPGKALCAAAITARALNIAIEELSSWTITTQQQQSPSSGNSSNNSNSTTSNAVALSECVKLSKVVAVIASHISLVAYPHDPLRQCLSKHGIAWDDELIGRVRWAAQHAAGVVMQYALTCSENAQRIKGPFQRQAVLQPLGYAVMSTFAVHQLAGGFGGDAAVLCDSLIERTVHYARLIDPKWFRGTRVVAT